MLSRFFFLSIFPIFFINCANKQLKTKMQLESITQDDLAAVISTLPDFKNIYIKNTSFLFKNNSTVHSLRASFFLSYDSLALVNIYTPFYINVLTFKATKDSIFLTESKNKISLSYSDLSNILGFPSSLNTLISILTGQKLFSINYVHQNTFTKNLDNYVFLKSKFSESRYEQLQLLLPYNKIVTREIFSSEAIILKSFYTITESNDFKLPKIVNIRFAVMDDEYEVEYSLKNASINIPLN